VIGRDIMAKWQSVTFDGTAHTKAGSWTIEIVL